MTHALSTTNVGMKDGTLCGPAKVGLGTPPPHHICSPAEVTATGVGLFHQRIEFQIDVGLSTQREEFHQLRIYDRSTKKYVNHIRLNVSP